MRHAPSPSSGARSNQTLLTLVVALLAVLAMNNLASVPSSALAAPREDRESSSDSQAMSFPNASQQRARMIAILESLDKRLQKVEGAFAGPMPVKVTEMPEVRVAE
ncbi:MAG TPA: hypothetical protein VG797_06650 [Phycisphaerales bacterium]|nr:hypothetical protein [Phycisphaerales bacterium]